MLSNSETNELVDTDFKLHLQFSPDSPQNIDLLMNGNVSELTPTSRKIEGICLIDCVDLTDDKYLIPIRQNIEREKPAEKIQRKNLTILKSKKDTQTQRKQRASFSNKSKKETSSQTKMPLYFNVNPKSTVKRATKKIMTSIERINEFAVRRLNCETRRLSFRRKTLKSEEQPTAISSDLCQDFDKNEDTKKNIQLPLPLQKRPIILNSEKSICPSYKVVEGTTFCVDGFKFGRIEGVTAYFLTHYHSDHYIGLTRKFFMPIYVSQITANIMREFIPVDEKFVNVLPLNIPTTIENIQVTAIDANHCPGAVMLLFQLPCGKRILHTGDFRANFEMRENPRLSQQNIDLLYLDTTYMSHKYSFQTQEQSIADAIKHVQDFKERNAGKRILFVVGAYLVGKEKFWLPIAKKFDFKIWTDSNRKKIMHAIAENEVLHRLVTKPREADMHIISMMKVGYRAIQSYWEDHSDSFDMIFAIRPSGWEINSKPQFRGRVNIVGIEYSEHSSHEELRTFLSFLQPQRVISTVPCGKDQTKCLDVPLSWYKKGYFWPIKKQASLLNYFKSSKIDMKS